MIGLVYALKDEADYLLKNIEDLTQVNKDIYTAKHKDKKLVIAICGIGKANAAMFTSYLKTKYDVEYIINSGNSGGLDKEISLKDVVIVDNLNYHDFHSEALGCLPGQVPDLPAKYTTFSTFDDISFSDFTIHRGGAISGDAFSFPNIAYPGKLAWEKALCIDMESCAVAQTCYVMGMKYICVRSIPDIAITGGNNFEIYQKNAFDSSVNANKVVLKIIEKITL